MKKSLYAIIVIILSSIGAHALASEFDINVKRASIETTDKTGNDNYGGKGCGTLREK